MLITLPGEMTEMDPEPSVDGKPLSAFYIPDRMIIFIDARNLIKANECHNALMKDNFSFNYRMMMQYFQRKYKVIRGYFYDGAPHKSEQTKERIRFYNELRRLGITLRLKEIDFKSPSPSQKGVDIYLTADMISLAYEDAYDIAVIFSGDGDYVALIDLVKSKGKKVWVASFKEVLSYKLRDCADKILMLNNMKRAFDKNSQA